MVYKPIQSVLATWVPSGSRSSKPLNPDISFLNSKRIALVGISISPSSWYRRFTKRLPTVDLRAWLLPPLATCNPQERERTSSLFLSLSLQRQAASKRERERNIRRKAFTEASSPLGPALYIDKKVLWIGSSHSVTRIIRQRVTLSSSPLLLLLLPFQHWQSPGGLEVLTRLRFLPFDL